jgi:peptidoglycan/xylan/chitin deacetylase (PgdA/CDA1 family)
MHSLHTITAVKAARRLKASRRYSLPRPVPFDVTGLVGVGDGTNAGLATKTNVGSVDKADMGVQAILLNLGNDPEYQNVTAADTRIGVGGTYRGASGVTNPTISDVNVGKFWSSFDISDLSGHPSGVSQIDLRLQNTSSAPKAEVTSVERWYRNAIGRPTILLTFDNAYLGVYQSVLPKLKSLGLKASCFVAGDGPSGDVLGGDFHMTVAMLKELYDAGWDICPNGTSTDNPMSSATDAAAAVADIETIKTWLSDRGFRRGLDCFCYPNGVARVAGNKVQVAAVTADGSNVVTMASTTGITVGREVAGPTVPAVPDTTVLAVTDATHLTLSANIPAGTTPMSFTDTSGPFHTGKLQAALKAAGYKFGRLTANGTRYTRMGLGDMGLVFPVYSLNSFADLAAFQTRLDAVEKRGHTICLFAHNVSDTDVLPATFNAFADEIATRVNANRFDMLTMSQFIARDGKAFAP